ncbi:MFS transporter [Gandjariella thermophila]|uniref:MFS transporter n=1 Tax=Gandjariella thermophila TaxID=1931992 RepID=A0A4D4JDM8_9PSEU|nr:MFS transporter [Gandjariella thermophila]GDY33734.1 MFS transporter [Gandjariella thermophila]
MTASTRIGPDATGAGLPARLVLPIALGTLLQALNSSMMAVALGQIRDEFHAGADASWLISALYLATAVGAPTMGRLADLVGPRRVFLGGLAVTAVAAVAAVFAPTMGWLIAMRVLLGIGTSAPYPAGLAMIRAEADRLGLPGAAGGLGVLAIAGQVTVAFGPALGGALVQLAGWRAIFLVNVPFLVAAAAFAVRFLPAMPGTVGVRNVLVRLDVAGMVLFAGAMGALMLALLSVPGHPSWSGLAPPLAAAVLLAGLLVVRELRCAAPFLDVRLLARNGALTATYLRTALTYVAFYAVFYGLPAWLERGRGLAPAEVGLVVLPIACLGAITAATAARLSRWRGARPLLVTGSAAFLAGGLAMTGTGAGTPVAVLALLAALLGLPNGFNNIGNQTALYAAAPAERMGAASGLYRTSQYIGANVAAGLIEITFAGPPSDAGLHRMAAAVVGIAAVLLVTGLASRRLRVAGTRPVRAPRHRAVDR